MNTRVWCLTLVHEISVSLDGLELMSMIDFSSAKFSQLYLKELLSPNVSRNMLDYTAA